MKPKLVVHTLILFAPVALLTGCVGFNTTLFMTKSNAGLDFDAKPPTAEINISRKEGVVEPSFEGGKTPPVMASFASKIGSGGGVGRFFFGVDQTFAGGDAAVTMAKLYDTNGVPLDNDQARTNFDSGLELSKLPKSNTQAGKGWLGWKKRLFGLPEPGEVRPFFFGTDTQLGVKVAWNGVGGPYPDTIKIGFQRKEMAVAPVTLTPREVLVDTPRTNVIRIPSFLATVDSNVEGEGGVEVNWMQYFATGDSASYLARQPGVRVAMSKRADPKAQQESTQIKAAQKTIADLKAKGEELAIQVTNQVDRIKAIPNDPAASPPNKLDAAVETLKESGLLDEANTQLVRTSTAADKERVLKTIASKRRGPGDVPKLEKYLNLLKAIN